MSSEQSSIEITYFLIGTPGDELEEVLAGRFP
jgi:hypothetical protein